jgi:hypothetical protein
MERQGLAVSSKRLVEGAEGDRGSAIALQSQIDRRPEPDTQLVHGCLGRDAKWLASDEEGLYYMRWSAAACQAIGPHGLG